MQLTATLRIEQSVPSGMNFQCEGRINRDNQRFQCPFDDRIPIAAGNGLNDRFFTN